MQHNAFFRFWQQLAARYGLTAADPIQPQELNTHADSGHTPQGHTQTPKDKSVAKDGAAMPLDARLMDAAASLLLVLAGMIMLCLVLLAVARLPVFALQEIDIKSDLQRTSRQEVRSTVWPRLQGNFFSVSLTEVREAFEDLPWIRSAVVRRVFPNRLMAELQEHQEVAYWGGDAPDEYIRLLSEQGDIFEVKASDMAGQGEHVLPLLYGPDAEAQAVLEAYRALAPLFGPLQQRLQRLEQVAGASWVATLEGGTVIQLGRGDIAQLRQRVQQYVQSVPSVLDSLGRKPQDVQRADMRYRTAGYALHVRGVRVQPGGVTGTVQGGRRQ